MARLLFCGWTTLVCLTVFLTSCVDLLPPPEPESGDTDDTTGQLADRVGSGSARLTGVVQSAAADDPLPLGGVLVVLGDAAAVSRVDGSFELAGVPAGEQLFIVDGSHVRTGDGQYGQFVTSLPVADGEQRAFDRPIHLPFVPNASRHKITPDRETIVTTDGGVSLIVPPGAARLGGDEYDGFMSVIVVQPDRTPLPLPSELETTASLVITVQPAGVEFPVTAVVRFADENVAEGRAAMSLFTLDPKTGRYRDTGLVGRSGHHLESVAGGIGVSGWHVLADPRVGLIAPCDQSDADAGRACLRAWMTALREFVELGSPLAAGARGPMENLRAALAFGGRTLAEAAAVLEATLPDYRLARANIDAASYFYVKMAGIGVVRDFVGSARQACEAVGACGAADVGVTDSSEQIDEALDELTANVNDFGLRYARLEAAVDALEPFFEAAGLLTDETLPALSEASAEYLSALAAFDAPDGSVHNHSPREGRGTHTPPDAPVDAYDAAIDARRRLEAAIRANLENFSTQTGTVDGDSSMLLRICADEGVRSVGLAENGTAPLSLGATDNGSQSDCLIVAMNLERDLCSAATRQNDFIERLSPPSLIALDRSVSRQSVVPNVPVSGAVDDDSPVHVWTFDAPERQGADIVFVPEGPALAALATPLGGASLPGAEGELAQIAGRGGFHVANLPGKGPFSIQVIGLDLNVDQRVPYAFTVDIDGSRFDFGQAVTGSFDILRRAQAILFEATEGERVFVETSCGDSAGPCASRVMIDPSGEVMPRIDGSQPGSGISAEIFPISRPGLHRVVLTPAQGTFPDYELVLRKVAPNPPMDYEPGSVVAAVLDDPGEVVVYIFDGSAGATAILEGVASVGLETVTVSVRDPDGAAIVDDAPLYFDGSSFSRLTFEMTGDGEYLMSFRARLSGQALTGVVTFRLDVQIPPDTPQLWE